MSEPISFAMINSTFPRFHLLFIILLASSITLAQTSLREIHDETPDDSYITVDQSIMPRTPAYNVRTSTFFTTQVNVDSNGNNIVGDAANEPSIAVDPTNPDRIVIGWRQFDTTANNFRQAGYGYSLDGGQTFTFPGVLDPGNFRSDPVLDFDADGNFYYNSLQGTFDCDVFTINDGGVVWGSPAPANGGDKQWMRMDRSGGTGDAHNYSFWNVSFTTCAPGAFTRSTDGSQTFETCVNIPNDPFWGTLAVDSNGVLYVVGNSGVGLVVVKSTTAQNPAIIPVSWDSFGTVDLDGTLTAGAPVNPVGLVGQAWIDVDVFGNVYVAASVERSSNSDPADVMFAKSTDGGNTFSAPIKINTDSGTSAYQWFGTMSVAPNGRIDMIWLDTRDAPGGTFDSVLYYSFSDDQGTTWSANEPISAAFDPTIGYPQQDKMGDYFDMVSDNRGAHLAWANTLNGGQDVYYTFIDPDSILGVEDISGEEAINFVAYPNPFSEEITLEFNSASEAQMTVSVFDLLGRKHATLLDESVLGAKKLKWTGVNEQGQKLNSGLYFISVQTSKGKQVVKVLLR